MPPVAPIDVLLLLMVVIWGSNFSVVKLALREFSPLALNGLRLVLASTLFLLVLSAARRPPPGGSPTGFGAVFRPREVAFSGRDWLGLVGLGAIGHTLYQICFMGSLARTSVANGALIMGCTPVAVALISAALGAEAISGWHWAGTVLSVGGIYLVSGRDVEVSGASLPGDLLMMAAVSCWAVYTVASRPLLRRHSPLVVTGYSMAFGTVFYLPLAWRDMAAIDWGGISAFGWGAVVFSAVFALCVAYLIWYTAVQRIGGARTSAYSNMTPVAALVVAVLWLGEPLPASTLLGAAAIVGGVALTKIGARPAVAVPPEE